MNKKTVPETNWKNHLIKAEQFYQSAEDAKVKENWNAVGLNAVHAAISANDAVTIHKNKLRSASENHADAVELLIKVLPQDPEAKHYSSHLQWLIRRKNLIEYESRLFYKKEADEAILHVGRFLKWVKSKLPL